MPSVIPGFIKSWTISPNNAFTSGGISAFNDSCNMMVLVVNFLVANGWAVTGCGTGGTAAHPGAYSSNSNLWVSPSSFGNAYGGSAWICLHNTTMGGYLAIVQGASSGYSYFAWYGSYIGWSGGAPNAYTLPTAPADQFLCNLQQATAYPFQNTGNMFSAKYHTWISSDGYCQRFLVYVNSVPVFYLHFEKPTNPIAGFPSMVFAVNDQGSSTTVNVCLVATVASGMFWSWFGAAKQGIVGCFVYINTTRAQSGITSACLLDGNWPITPVGAGQVAGTYTNGFYFWFADLWVVASSLQEGCLMPSTPNYQVVVVGDLLLPWLNGSTPMQVTG